MATKANAEVAAPVYNKAQLLASKKYANRQDILNALLDDGKTYTTAQVDALIEKYMKGQVK
ncbi:MAG: hypothetical protein IJA81_10180 [Akkermansia sp.]|nr:hypothetical protein [Clostridia bacterium]MBQ4594989.1 hypothetical protein [Akkermansia sp.]